MGRRPGYFLRKLIVRPNFSTNIHKPPFAPTFFSKPILNKSIFAQTSFHANQLLSKPPLTQTTLYTNQLYTTPAFGLHQWPFGRRNAETCLTFNSVAHGGNLPEPGHTTQWNNWRPIATSKCRQSPHGKTEHFFVANKRNRPHCTHMRGFDDFDRSKGHLGTQLNLSSWNTVIFA